MKPINSPDDIDLNVTPLPKEEGLSTHPVPEGFRNGNKPRRTQRKKKPTYKVIPGKRNDTAIPYTTKEMGRVFSAIAGGSVVFSASFWIAGGAIVYFLYMIFEYIKGGSLVIVGSHLTVFYFRLLGLYLATIIIHKIGSSYDSFVNKGKRMDNFLWFCLLIFVVIFVFGAGYLSYNLFSPAITGADTIFSQPFK